MIHNDSYLENSTMHNAINVLRRIGRPKVRATVGDPSPSWVQLLQECQKEIAEIGGNLHYAKAYRAEEFEYWSHVPKWIDEDARTIRPTRCLDVGCAYGTLLLFTKKLTDCDAYGIDFVDCFMSAALVAKHGLHHAVCNIELGPCPYPGPFEMILFTEILEHLNFQCVPTLEKLAALLAPDGRLYLSTPDAAEWGRVEKYYTSYSDLPNPSSDWKSGVIDDHVWQFNIDELTGCIQRAGMRVVRLDYAPGSGKCRHFNATLARA